MRGHYSITHLWIESQAGEGARGLEPTADHMAYDQPQRSGLEDALAHCCASFCNRADCCGGIAPHTVRVGLQQCAQRPDEIAEIELGRFFGQADDGCGKSTQCAHDRREQSHGWAETAEAKN